MRLRSAESTGRNDRSRGLLLLATGTARRITTNPGVNYGATGPGEGGSAKRQGARESIAALPDTEAAKPAQVATDEANDHSGELSSHRRSRTFIQVFKNTTKGLGVKGIWERGANAGNFEAKAESQREELALVRHHGFDPLWLAMLVMPEGISEGDASREEGG